MKATNLFLLPALIAVLNLILAGRVRAQTYTVLKNFSGTNGSTPIGGLVSSGSTLYGTTSDGGSPYDGVHYGNGTVFKVNTDGSGFIVMRNFAGGDGAHPGTGLVLSGSTLYGAAGSTLFKVNTDGSGYTILWNLGSAGGANLVLADGTLYGTTAFGGTVFKINTNGSDYAVLRNLTGSDGIGPVGLVLSGSTLYGTAANGGSSGNGTVFKVNTSGSGFTVLKNFEFGAGDPSARTGLVLSGSTLYGTTEGGGSSECGTVFKIKTDGSGYTVLKNFSEFGNNWTNSDGGTPYAGVVLSGDTLCGTTSKGGSFGKGVVFSLKLSPLLNYTPQTGQLVLSWNDPTFALQSAPASTGTFTNLPAATSPYTNAITGAQKYFRLISN